MKTQYLVSADHNAPQYCFRDELVDVHYSRCDDLYYANHPTLGCGKQRETPIGAIKSLFRDHACRNIEAERVVAR